MSQTSWWPSLLAAIITVVGWLVNDLLNDRRDQRKELRARLDALGEMLSDLEEKAISYHTGAVVDGVGKRKVLSLISQIGLSLPRIRDQGLSKLDTRRRMVAVRNAITMENFDSKFTPQDPGNELIASIHAALSDLHDHVEKAYTDRYFSPRLRFRIARL